MSSLSGAPRSWIGLTLAIPPWWSGSVCASTVIGADCHLAIDKQQRACPVYQSWPRMDAEPQLAVRVFANIHHPERRRTSSFHKTPPPPTPSAQLARSLKDRFAARSGQTVVFLTSITIRARFPDSQHRAVPCQGRRCGCALYAAHLGQLHRNAQRRNIKQAS